MASIPIRLIAAAVVLVLLLAGCDNVGRAFDPGKGGEQPDPASQVQLPPEGGITRSARAKVLFAGPDGSGVPSTTPVRSAE